MEWFSALEIKSFKHFLIAYPDGHGIEKREDLEKWQSSNYGNEVIFTDSLKEAKTIAKSLKPRF